MIGLEGGVARSMDYSDGDHDRASADSDYVSIVTLESNPVSLLVIVDVTAAFALRRQTEAVEHLVTATASAFTSVAFWHFASAV